MSSQTCDKVQRREVSLTFGGIPMVVCALWKCVHYAVVSTTIKQGNHLVVGNFLCVY